jgi:hypothetical protein
VNVHKCHSELEAVTAFSLMPKHLQIYGLLYDANVLEYTALKFSEQLNGRYGISNETFMKVIS